MKSFVCRLSLLLLAATPTLAVAQPQLPSFPGAMGGGAESVGGRGGKVYEVTKNSDGGTGSLRDCAMALGPRTCIFRVAGLFPLLTDLRVYNPYLTVACQSAPGQVVIGGPKTGGMLFGITTHDIISRYCTYSPDNASTPSGPDTGTVSITIVNCAGDGSLKGGGCYNVMIDHPTTRWSGNKSEITTSNFTPGKGTNGNGTGPNHKITVSNGLDYEPHEGHPVGYGTATDETCVGTRADPKCVSPYETDIDYHHNLFVNVHHRIPENSNGSTRWVNNGIFNWGWYANEFLGAEIIDAIGNKYVCGNLNTTGAQKYPIHFTTNSPEMSGAPSVYVAGNMGCGDSTPPADQYGKLVNQITGENGDETGPIPDSWKRSGPMPNSAFPIKVDPVEDLDSIMLPTVGNSQHVDCDGHWMSHRDAADTRIINQYKNRASGGYWPNGVTFTGQSSFPTPTADWQDNPVVNGTVCVESMHDGIPDQWKRAKGLSTTDPNLYNAKAPSGYTWLETYLNPDDSAVVTPSPAPTTSPTGTTITPGSSASITDSAGNVWTFGAPVDSRGNAVMMGGTQQTVGVVLLWYHGAMYVKTATGSWWGGSGFNTKLVNGDPRGTTPPPVIAVQVSCPNITFPATSTCTAAVTGTANQTVTWSANAPAGVYTSVAGVTSATVTATSVADPTKSGSATVSITQPAPPSQPTYTLTVASGGTVLFTVTCSAVNGIYSCK